MRPIRSFSNFCLLALTGMAAFCLTAGALCAQVTVSPTSISRGSDVGSIQFTITVDGTRTWTAKSEQSWIALSKTSGTATTTFPVYFLANNETTIRSGSITIVTEKQTVIVPVTQEGTKATVTTLTVTPEKVTVPAAGVSNGDNNIVSVSSSTVWTARSNEAWLTLTSLSGAAGTRFLSFTASTNTGTTSRSAVVTVTAGDLTRSVTFTQDGTKATVSAPTITGFSPSSGGPETRIVITGTNLDGVRVVRIGDSTLVTRFTIDSPTQITATVGKARTGFIVVVKEGNVKAISSTQFTYQEPKRQDTTAVPIGSGDRASLQSLLKTLPTPRTTSFDFTVLSTSANGTLVRTPKLKEKSVQAEIVLVAGDTFSYSELVNDVVVFKPSNVNAKNTASIEFVAPAGIYGTESQLVTAKFTATATGVHELNTIAFVTVYPNPIMDEVTVNLPTVQAGECAFNVVAVDGSTVWSARQKADGGLLNYTLNLKSLPEGIYILQITNGLNQYATKIIKH